MSFFLVLGLLKQRRLPGSIRWFPEIVQANPDQSITLLWIRPNSFAKLECDLSQFFAG